MAGTLVLIRPVRVHLTSPPPYRHIHASSILYPTTTSSNTPPAGRCRGLSPPPKVAPLFASSRRPLWRVSLPPLAERPVLLASPRSKTDDPRHREFNIRTHLPPLRPPCNGDRPQIVRRRITPPPDRGLRRAGRRPFPYPASMFSAPTIAEAGVFGFGKALVCALASSSEMRLRIAAGALDAALPTETWSAMSTTAC